VTPLVALSRSNLRPSKSEYGQIPQALVCRRFYRPCGLHTGMFGAWFEAFKLLLDAKYGCADTPGDMALAKSLSVYGLASFNSQQVW
jgi:hypothetical protein